MKIVIEFKTDGAAFQDARGAEIFRILDLVARRLDTGGRLTEADGFDVRDFNGNVCGSVKVVP